MTDRYFEDFVVGQTFGSGLVKIDKDRIKVFIGNVIVPRRPAADKS